VSLFLVRCCSRDFRVICASCEAMTLRFRCIELESDCTIRSRGLPDAERLRVPLRREEIGAC
jgi:hypothetical protein